MVLPQDQADARTRHHRVAKHHHVSHHHVVKRKLARHRSRSAGRSVSLAGVTPVLAAKARQIVASCGSVIVSAVSRRGIRSNHPIGRAVDLTGNPGCIYAHLKGWPGGYSTDYSAVRHVHISYNPGGQEWGLHFAHGGHHRHAATRYARLRTPRKLVLSAAPTHRTYNTSAQRDTAISARRRGRAIRYVRTPRGAEPQMFSAIGRHKNYF